MMALDPELAALVPDPLPLRTIQTPRAVTRVDGCDCGGLEWHRAADGTDPGCSIWRLPHGQAMAAVDAAQERSRQFTAELNRRLRLALGQ